MCAVQVRMFNATTISVAKWMITERGGGMEGRGRRDEQNGWEGKRGSKEEVKVRERRENKRIKREAE